MKNNNLRTFLYLCTLILIIGIAAACSDSSSKKKDESQPNMEQKAALEDVDAKEIQNVIFGFKKKKAMLVNVWATWCMPCVEEFPEIVKIQRKYPEKLQVIFISADFKEDRDRAEKFLKKHNVDWITYFKADKDEPFINAISKDWSGALPFTQIISADGEEIAHWENKADFDTFDKYVKQAINP